jgi:hypothetical protein
MTHHDHSTMRVSAREQGESPHTSEDDSLGRASYEAPRLTVLGSVAELTQGGNVSESGDGQGFSGGSGMIP